MIEPEIYKFLNDLAPSDSAFLPLNKQLDRIRATNLIAYGSAIKSIQRGFLSGEEGATTPRSAAITISPINPNKAFALLDGTTEHITNLVIYKSNFIYTAGLASTSLSVGGATYSYRSTSASNYIVLYGRVSLAWQVIEFY